MDDGSRQYSQDNKKLAEEKRQSREFGDEGDENTDYLTDDPMARQINAHLKGDNCQKVSNKGCRHVEGDASRFTREAISRIFAVHKSCQWKRKAQKGLTCLQQKHKTALYCIPCLLFSNELKRGSKSVLCNRDGYQISEVSWRRMYDSFQIMKATKFAELAILNGKIYSTQYSQEVVSISRLNDNYKQKLRKREKRQVLRCKI